MKIYFLGTNGWYTTATGSTPCTLIDAKEAYIVLDAGNALYKLDRYITDENKPIHLFLSHFHLDHISGLHSLLKFKFKQGISIWGQPGTEKTLQTFINKPFTAPIEKLGLAVNIKDLKEGKYQQPVSLECRYLVHIDPCFGYRFELEGKKIAYCTDTGVCENLEKLAAETDIFITECAWKKKAESKWPHLSPYDAAETAVKAKCKNMVLMHFDAYKYPKLEDRKWAEQEAKKIFPNTQSAMDDMELIV